jgi:hypothetical protein
LPFAHALVRAADSVEVFTMGTRLTRITRPLRLRNREQALGTASLLVADWDGGTRIGDALNAFLAVPRFAALARGAALVVLSDGLERGDPTAMADAVARFARLPGASSGSRRSPPIRASSAHRRAGRRAALSRQARRRRLDRQHLRQRPRFGRCEGGMMTIA